MRMALHLRGRPYPHSSNRRTSMNFVIHTEPETRSGILLDAVVPHGTTIRAFDVFQQLKDERLTRR